MFTSSCKLFTSYTKLANEAWHQMCTFLYLNGVDIFEMNDKRGNGMEYRILDDWPTNLKEWRADPTGNSKIHKTEHSEIIEVLNCIENDKSENE